MIASTMTKIPIGLREVTIQYFRGIDHLELTFPDTHSGVSDIVVLAGRMAAARRPSWRPACSPLGTAGEFWARPALRRSALEQ